jgi:hypothetical protein
MIRKEQNARVKRNDSESQAAPPRVREDTLSVALEKAVDRLQGMSQEQRVESLKAAGILTRHGKLARAYR